MRLGRRAIRAAVAAAVAAGSLIGLIGAGVIAGAIPAGAASGSTVLVGDLCSCTGPEASTISQTTSDMQAWASWVDSHGGLAGHNVKVVVEDDAYNPGQAIVAADRLVNSDHVAAIFDNSDEDPSWGPIAKSAGVPVLGGQETESGWQNSDFYPPGGTFNYTDENLSITEKKYGVTKLADLYCVEVTICAPTRAGEEIAAKYGIKNVYTAGISFAAPNYTAQCLAAKQSGATGMSVGDASAVYTKVVQDCAAQGYTPKEFSSDGTVAIEWLKVPAFNGNVDTQSDLPWFVHNSATKDMYAALDKYAPGVPKGPNYGEVVLQSWASGALLQAAVEAAHASSSTPITPALVKKGLYSLPAGETLGGLTPSPIHFVKGQPANNSCVDIMGIKDGKFVDLNGGKAVCAPLVKAGTMPT